MKQLLNIFKGIVLWATFVLPIYCFDKMFRTMNIDDSELVGVYQDALLLFSIIAIALTLVALWLSTKIFHKPLYKIVVIITYLGFYTFACTSIAWDYRIIFGTTWQCTEIFPALVQPQWYFYVFGILGVLCNYLLLKVNAKHSH